MFKNFVKKEAVCELHQNQISFINISSNLKKGNRALCEECELHKPINLKKGEEILNNIDKFNQKEIQRRTNQMIETISSEIDNLEKEMKQLISKVRNQIIDIQKTNTYNPFEKYQNLTVYTTSNYQEIAELLKNHYSLKEDKYILTKEFEQCIQNSLKDFQDQLNEIRITRRYIQQIGNHNPISNQINNQYVTIQICESFQLIECHIDTTFKELLLHFYQDQEKKDIKYYYKNKLIQNLNSTLREVGFEEQSPLIMKRIY